MDTVWTEPVGGCISGPMSVVNRALQWFADATSGNASSPPIAIQRMVITSLNIETTSDDGVVGAVQSQGGDIIGLTVDTGGANADIALVSASRDILNVNLNTAGNGSDIVGLDAGPWRPPRRWLRAMQAAFRSSDGSGWTRSPPR